MKITLTFLFAVQLATAGWAIPTHLRVMPLVGCDTTMTNETGTINSPGFPNNYLPNLNCTWLIFGPMDKGIQLTFSTFLTEPGQDFVKVYGGPSTVSTLLLNHSGYDLPGPVTSSANGMLVHMTSNGATQYAGFKADYASVIVTTTPGTTTAGPKCGGTLLGSGEFTTPHHPEHYDNSTECIWHLQSSSQFITLTFTAFKTENKGDFVEVYEGPDTTGNMVGNPLTGTLDSMPYVIGSNTTNMFTVRFTSDDTISDTGFKANFS